MATNEVKWTGVASKCPNLVHPSTDGDADFVSTDNAHPLWYRDAGLRRNVALGLGLCLVIATNVSRPVR